MITENHFRILHEYEISDPTGLHSASIVYLRRCTDEKNGWCDIVDSEMERCINNYKGCKVLRKLPPSLITLQSEVDGLNKRLKDEYQLKGYFSFFAPSEIKGGSPTAFSRVVIHTSILVKELSDVNFFENIGYQENVGDASWIVKFILIHFKNPVYLLQEHPLVHSIVCFKDALRTDVVYFLYRYNSDPLESILAEVDVANLVVRLKLGTDNVNCDEIERFANSIESQNNLSPLYHCVYITNLTPIYVTRLQLNRERELFSKAKDLLDAELERINQNSCVEMKRYLTTMQEA